MVRSRSGFLDRGHYAQLADALSRAVASIGGERCRPLEILDSGCGEGYFLARLRSDLKSGGVEARLRGADVSRPAVRAAANRDRSLHLAVASIHRLPIASASLDLVLRVLAPLDAAEFRRVLRPDGRLLAVTPGPDHLLALRKLVYETPRARDDEPAPEGFELLRRDRLAFPVRLESAQEVGDLLAMTPYYWHAGREARERIAVLERLATSEEFVLSLYERGT